MTAILSILIVVILIITILFVIGTLLSFKFTQRSYLRDTSSPAEAGLDFSNVTFPASDGLILRGWYIPADNNNNRTVIQLHGHAGSMDPDIHYARDFHEAGFNVLMFDFRAHGRSEGKVCTFGYLERYDVLGAINFVKSQGAKWIALMGFSMGGMAALLTAPLTKDVQAVISDGAPIRIKTALKVYLREKKIPGRLSIPLIKLVLIMTSLRMGVNLEKFEPIRWVQKISPIPLMLIHGEADEFCPDFNEMAAMAQGAEIWREQGIGHVQISQQLPEKYKQRVNTFLKNNLAVKEGG